MERLLAKIEQLLSGLSDYLSIGKYSDNGGEPRTYWRGGETTISQTSGVAIATQTHNFANKLPQNFRQRRYRLVSTRYTGSAAAVGLYAITITYGNQTLADSFTSAGVTDHNVLLPQNWDGTLTINATAIATGTGIFSSQIREV